MTAAATDQQIRVKRVNGRWPSDAASDGGSPRREQGHGPPRKTEGKSCSLSQITGKMRASQFALQNCETLILRCDKQPQMCDPCHSQTDSGVNSTFICKE